MAVNRSSLSASICLLAWFYTYVRSQTVPLTSAVVEVSFFAAIIILLYFSYRLLIIAHHVIE